MKLENWINEIVLPALLVDGLLLLVFWFFGSIVERAGHSRLHFTLSTDGAGALGWLVLIAYAGLDLLFKKRERVR